CGDDLDLTGGQLGVLVAGLARGDVALDLDAPLGAQPVRVGQVAEDDLDDTAGVAQVDERHAAVVTPGADPTREDDAFALVLPPQGTGVVGPDHESLSLTTVTISSSGTA